MLRDGAVKAPEFGERRKAMLQDIAILTGGQVTSEEIGLRLEDATPSSSSGAPSAWWWTRTTPRSSAGPAAATAIEGRLQQIRREIEKATSDYDREKLEERLATLAGGVAVIRVGVPSEVEMKSRNEALDDAISATKAAVAEG